MKSVHLNKGGGGKGGQVQTHPHSSATSSSSNRSHPNKMDGKKSENDCFMYNMAILVGCPCEVTIRDGRKFDGIFSAFASDRHELMIEAAHLVTDGVAEDSPITDSFDVLVVPTEKMLYVRFKSVDTNYATRDFATDTAISSARNMSLRDKELTPWDGPDVGSDDDLSLGNEVNSKTNGWRAEDMFQKNEEKYGVTSSYKQDLSGYTTKLDKTDSESFKRHEEQASRVAQEIEKNTISWERNELENGDDEEEAFSAVVRPTATAASNAAAAVHRAPTTLAGATTTAAAATATTNHSTSYNINNNNNNNPASASVSIGGTSDKYIPPSRRTAQSTLPQQQQQQQQQNVPMNSGPSQMNNNNIVRKGFGQNQNPRYNAPPGNSYHDRRNNYDNRRGPHPQPNQYPPPPMANHADRRGMDDGMATGGGRPQRMPNKLGDRRGGRDDPSKLRDFGKNFVLSTDQNSRGRMPPMVNQPPNLPSHVPSHRDGAGDASSSSSCNSSNRTSPPNTAAAGPGHGHGRGPPPSSVGANKGLSEEGHTKQPQMAPTGAPTPPSTQVQPITVDVSKGVNSSGASGVTSVSTPPSSANLVSSSSTPSLLANTPTNTTITTTADSTPAGSSLVQTPSSCDSKSSEAERKFRFNAEAKEFVPSGMPAKPFTSRSPSTPPRPPSTPGQLSTPQQQMMPSHSQISSYMPIHMPYVYAQPYAQSALTPSSSSSASSGGATPRHGGGGGGAGMGAGGGAGHRKGAGGGMIGVPPRSDMTPPSIPMTAGHPLILPASLQSAGGAPPQYYVPQGAGFPQVMRLPHQMYPTSEGSGSTQMHQQVHFMPHNGAPTQTTGHPNSNQPSNASSGSNQTPVVSANGQGYNQGAQNPGGGNPHVGFPYGVLPMMNIAYPHGPPQMITTLPYVTPHQ